MRGDKSECVEHVWVVRGAVFAADAQVESHCARCGAVSVETSMTLNPGHDVGRLEDPFLYDDPEVG
jgi:hypothetical protein